MLQSLFGAFSFFRAFLFFERFRFFSPTFSFVEHFRYLSVFVFDRFLHFSTVVPLSLFAIFFSSSAFSALFCFSKRFAVRTFWRFTDNCFDTFLFYFCSAPMRFWKHFLLVSIPSNILAVLSPAPYLVFCFLFFILRRMGKNKAEAPTLPRAKYMPSVNLTRRSRCNSSSRCCYRACGHVDPT